MTDSFFSLIVSAKDLHVRPTVYILEWHFSLLKLSFFIFLCYSSGDKVKSKEPPVKKKKQAEELVDRVFRKTGGGFGVSI